MIKVFNILLPFNDIANCYKTNTFPNAHCLLWNKERGAELLITQICDILKPQDKKGVSTDGTSTSYF